MANGDETETDDLRPVGDGDDQASLLNKAESFSQDAHVKEAPQEQKRAFLRSKGLSDLEIERVFGKETVSEIVEEVDGEEKSAPLSKDTEVSSEPWVTKETTSDGPPIITYPEFLQHSKRPPPLVTASRLLTSAYVISGAAALLYGTGKYLVQPMVESLSSSRHSLYETTSANLSILTEKLETNVSAMPESQMQKDQDEDELDPSSCFYRTTGTQTSPDLASSPSKSSDSTEILASQTEQQASRLSNLKGSLEDLGTENSSDEAIQSSVQELREFLSQLPRSPNPSEISKSGSSWVDSKNDPSLAKVKAEIKGVKGVLLSARNFPSSVVR